MGDATRMSGWAGAPFAPTRPKYVDIAFWLWLTWVAADLVVTVLEFATSPQMPLPEAWPAFVLELALTVAVNALTVFFAFKMREGKNWARIWLIIWNGLELLGSPFTILTAVQPAMIVTVQVLDVFLYITAIVFMFLSAANIYFRSTQLAREQKDPGHPHAHR